ncbi:MAG: threonine--tRNA ligase [Deltaproteobacteria bacterium]|nr:threonine--tRNA ligase [Deltaproteobacteria bacterium]
MATGREILEARGGLGADVIAVRVGADVVDLMTSLPEGTSPSDVVPIRASDPDGLAVIRHSTAHVMADAVQRLFPGTQVTIGPAIDNGFYYDFARPSGQFTDEDLEKIEAAMRDIIGGNHDFRREVVSRPEAESLFSKLGETYKLEILAGVSEPITLYRHGGWVDLCAGPHVPNTRFLRAVKLTHVAGAYWRGDERNPMLQRIYGTAFATDAELAAHLAHIEEAKKRDHRKLGKELGLLGFHPWAPASPFFLPRGAALYSLLVDYVRALYREHGYSEVVTPQVYDIELMKRSGHYDNYREGMFFAVTADGGELSEPEKEGDAPRFTGDVRWGVKPMNCPGHCLLYAMDKRSYRDLPMRIADFGRLHRYERSGVTQGLTRVRTFAQDDAHVFCTFDQVADETRDFLGMLDRVYRDFAFEDVRIALATRPERSLGTAEQWTLAEETLAHAVRSAGREFVVNPGEGAFYGPKLEFQLKDALGRPWQLGTIQVDFNMPERFGLEYTGADNVAHQPVMLHRAILGSIERFLGVLIEHVGGHFPAWLAPEQVCVVTVSEKFNDYAREAIGSLRAAGLRVASDLGGDKLGAKIRNARAFRYPYLAVVGGREAEQRGLAVRQGDADLGFLTLDAFAARVRAESVAPSLRLSSPI